MKAVRTKMAILDGRDDWHNSSLYARVFFGSFFGPFLEFFEFFEYVVPQQAICDVPSWNIENTLKIFLPPIPIAKVTSQILNFLKMFPIETLHFASCVRSYRESEFWNQAWSPC